MAQIQFKGKSFVQNHHLLVKYHELIPKNIKDGACFIRKSEREKTTPNFMHVLHEYPG